MKNTLRTRLAAALVLIGLCAGPDVCADDVTKVRLGSLRRDDLVVVDVQCDDGPATNIAKSALAQDVQASLDRADTSVQPADIDPLLLAQYYPEGNVKSAAEFTAGIKYDAPDVTNRTITVRPFCHLYVPSDNSSLVGRVVIPPFVDGDGNGYISDDGTRYKVVGVSDDTYDDYSVTNLTAIIAPNTVTNIGQHAFYRCTSLASVSFPGVTSIGQSAFLFCSSLTSVSFPAATSIGSNAFYSCYRLPSVSLPAATNIASAAFAFCTALTSVSLPAATRIGGEAFCYCSPLTSVSFPVATTIGGSAFTDCFNLTSVSLPAATNFGAWLFSGCTSLTSVSLPSATTIREYMFQHCANLTSVSLPAVTNIGSYAFTDCSNLTSVSLPDATTISDRAFINCTSLASISLPSATYIGGFAFSGCTSLTSVSLPVVTDLEYRAFERCTALTSVDFGNTPRQRAPSYLAFGAGPSTCKFIMPDARYDAWTAQWRDFVPAGYTFLRHSEWEYARKFDVDKKADKPATFIAGNLAAFDASGNLADGGVAKSDVERLLFVQYYPDGSVKSAAEFTAGISYDVPDVTNRTITVKPFSNTGIAENDNSGLDGRVVIPPFVDASGNGYISDDGTRYKVVGVGNGSAVDANYNLTAIIASSTVTNIGESAFYNCRYLTSISLPSATDIRGTAFRGCRYLTSISLPSATTIWMSAFYDCDLLTSVSLPAATNIVSEAFGRCDSLTSVSLPAATNIGTGVFRDCISLTSVDFGDTPRPSVPTIGANVFGSVPASCKIIIPDAQYDKWTAASGWRNLVQAGYTFLRHSEWEYARRYEVERLIFAQYYPDGSVKSAAEFTAGISYDVPDVTNRTITVKPFHRTGKVASGNSSLAGRVVIPPFVDKQGNGYISDDGTRYKVVGVSGYDSAVGYLNLTLTAIVAPSTVTNIGQYAFYSCSALTSVSVPAATGIGDLAFFDCSVLTSVSFPAATNIGSNAFKGCSSLTSVSLPAAMNIGSMAFQDCAKLTSVSLPSATNIASEAFESCTALTSVSFPAVTSISEAVFSDCTSLTSVSLPAATDVEHWAFHHCSALTSVSLPAAMNIGSMAFMGCAKLTSVSLPAATTLVGLTFSGCTSLTSVSLPSATTIGLGTFRSRSKLTSVALPAATNIAGFAFGDCASLTSVSLPAVTTIQRYAFTNCISLTSVDFGGTPRQSVPSLDANAFYGVPTSCKIIVPDAQYDAWTAADGWRDLVTASYKFLKHSEWKYAHIYDATLTPIYSDTPTFSEWTGTVVDAENIVVTGLPYYQPRDDEHSESYGWHLPTANQALHLGVYDTGATSLSFNKYGDDWYLNYTATRTRTDIIGYTLGDQTDKPLQPKGDYAPRYLVTANLAEVAEDYTNNVWLCRWNNQVLHYTYIAIDGAHFWRSTVNGFRVELQDYSDDTYWSPSGFNITALDTKNRLAVIMPDGRIVARDEDLAGVGVDFDFELRGADIARATHLDFGTYNGLRIVLDKGADYSVVTNEVLYSNSTNEILAAVSSTVASEVSKATNSLGQAIGDRLDGIVQVSPYRLPSTCFPIVCRTYSDAEVTISARQDIVFEAMGDGRTLLASCYLPDGDIASVGTFTLNAGSGRWVWIGPVAQGVTFAGREPSVSSWPYLVSSAVSVNGVTVVGEDELYTAVEMATAPLAGWRAAVTSAQTELSEGFTAWAIEVSDPLSGQPVSKPSSVDLAVDQVRDEPGAWSLFAASDTERTYATTLGAVFSPGPDPSALAWGEADNDFGVVIKASRVRVPRMSDITGLTDDIDSRWTSVTNYIAWLEYYATNNYTAAIRANQRAKDIEFWQYTNSVTRADVEAGMTEWAVMPAGVVGRVVVRQLVDGIESEKWSLFPPTATSYDEDTALVTPQSGPDDVTYLAWHDVSWPVVVAGVRTNVTVNIDARRTRVSGVSAVPIVGCSAQSLGSGVDNANGSELFFRPRYFSMRPGDRLRAVTLVTRTSWATEIPTLYARLRDVSGSGRPVVAISEAAYVPAVALAAVTFRFSPSVTLPDSDHQYLLDFTTEAVTGDASMTGDTGVYPKTLGLRTYALTSASTDSDFFFFKSTIVPLCAFQYYTYAPELPTAQDNWSLSGQVFDLSTDQGLKAAIKACVEQRGGGVTGL